VSLQILLTKGQFALVDDGDYDALVRIGRWCYSNSGYTVHYVTNEQGKQKTLYMHRVIMARILASPIPFGLQVDHVSGGALGVIARLDNRRENLRLATRSQNQANKGRQSNNSSTFKGVSFNHGKWEARIRHNGRRIHLGRFEDARNAALMYDAASRRLYQDFAGCNFPDEGTPLCLVDQLRTILTRYNVL
jgi:hypothetical protein